MLKEFEEGPGSKYPAFTKKEPTSVPLTKA
jgi:hypothetical protein